MSDLFSRDDGHISSVKVHASYWAIEQFHDRARCATIATGIAGFLLLLVSTVSGSKPTASLDFVSATFSLSVILLCAAGIALFFWVAANLVRAAIESIGD